MIVRVDVMCMKLSASGDKFSDPCGLLKGNTYALATIVLRINSLFFILLFIDLLV